MEPRGSVSLLSFAAKIVKKCAEEGLSSPGSNPSKTFLSFIGHLFATRTSFPATLFQHTRTEPSRLKLTIDDVRLGCSTAPHSKLCHQESATENQHRIGGWLGHGGGNSVVKRNQAEATGAVWCDDELEAGLETGDDYFAEVIGDDRVT